jgi:hypothetical protein
MGKFKKREEAEEKWLDIGNDPKNIVRGQLTPEATKARKKTGGEHDIDRFIGRVNAERECRKITGSPDTASTGASRMKSGRESAAFRNCVKHKMNTLKPKKRKK